MPADVTFKEAAAALLRFEAEYAGGWLPRPTEPAPRAVPPAEPLPVTPEPKRPPALPLATLEAQVATCTSCDLHQGRTQTVFSRGSAEAELVFVGEGPGEQEDLRGEPFVGRAGQLLDKMVAAMGFDREAVYVCNVVKCRPPGNRNPTAAEAAACAPFLDAQLQAIRPKAIVALGKVAALRLGVYSEADPRPRWRGFFTEYAGFPLLATFHPSFLLRSPNFKRQAWEDLQQVLHFLGRAAPGR